MIKSLIVLATLLSALSAQCGNGCLTCHSSTNHCLYCDVNLGYVLKFGRCEMNLQKDCVHAANDGDCFVCTEGFYLDHNTNSCVEVPKEVTSDNCEVYSDQHSCILCNTGYYLNKGACLKTENPISNCQYNKSATECLTCNVGYTPSLDHTACIAANESNCFSYSFLECRSCISGYMMNDNYYIYNLLGFSNRLQNEMLNNQMAAETEKTKGLRSYGVCQAYTISNCSVYNTFNKCEVCNSNYLLQNDGICKSYPKERIDDCEIYSSYNQEYS